LPIIFSFGLAGGYRSHPSRFDLSKLHQLKRYTDSAVNAFLAAYGSA
jgi:hypothetical protein